MFSIIFAVMWLRTVEKCKHVTIDGIYIVLPILADGYVIIELFS